MTPALVTRDIAVSHSGQLCDNVIQTLGAAKLYPLIERRSFKALLGLPLVVLAHGGGKGAVALTDLAVPRLIHLLTNHGMIEATVAALDEAAKRAGAVPLPRFLVATEANQAHQHRVVVGQATSRKLVPRRRPKQHGIPARLRLFLCCQVAVTKPRDVQGHEREVLQVSICRHRGVGKGAHRRFSGM